MAPPIAPEPNARPMPDRKLTDPPDPPMEGAQGPGGAVDGVTAIRLLNEWKETSAQNNAARLAGTYVKFPSPRHQQLSNLGDVPDPQPWYWKDLAFLFATDDNKFLMHCTPYEDFTHAFRFAPKSFENFRDAHVRVLTLATNMGNPHAECDVFSATQRGPIQEAIDNIRSQLAFCEAMKQTHNNLLYRLKADFPKNYETGFNKRDLGTKEFSFVKGTDVRVLVNWTAEEIKTFSADPSSMMETQVAAAKVLLTTLIDKLGQANRLYAEEQRNRPPQEPAAAQPIADQGLVSTMVRSNAMTKLKKLDQARLNMTQREFERWLNTADDWVKDQSLPQLARASQASMVETMFDTNYWIRIKLKHESQRLRRNANAPMKETEASFIVWKETTPNHIADGAREIAIVIWEEVNAKQSAVAQFSHFFRDFAIPLYSGAYPLSTTQEITTTFAAGSSAFDNLPPNQMGNKDNLISTMILHNVDPDLQEDMDKAMRKCKAVEDHKGGYWKYDRHGKPLSLELPTLKLTMEVGDEKDRRTALARVTNKNKKATPIPTASNRCLVMDESHSEHLMFADGGNRGRDRNQGQAPQRRRTPSGIRPRSDSSRGRDTSRDRNQGPRRRQSKSPKQKIHDSWLARMCYRCEATDHVMGNCPRPATDFKCDGPEGCGKIGHRANICLTRLLKKYPHMALPYPGNDSRQSRADQRPQEGGPPRAASVAAQDHLLYAQAASAQHQSAPAQAGYAQAEPAQYTQQPAMQSYSQTQPPPQQQQQLTPAPQPAQLQQRSHTPVSQYGERLYFCTEKKSSSLPDISVLIWQSSPSGHILDNFRKPKDDKACTDTGCTTPMCSPEFVKKHSLAWAPITEEEARRHSVMMGNKEVTLPIGKTTMWVAIKNSERQTRREMFCLILPNLPVPFLIGLNELKCLGLLPKSWPNINPVDLTKEEVRQLQDEKRHPLSERERLANALLYLEGHSYDGEDLMGEGPTNHGPLDEDFDPSSISDRCAIDDSHFSSSTSVDQIPGYTDNTLDSEVKALCDEFKHVFQKTLKGSMHTSFAPVTFTLKDKFKPPPRARGCRPVPQHWRGEFDKMLDSMIEHGQVVQVMPGDPVSPFLSSMFLVDKPNDPSKPRIVIDYSKLKDLFVRNPFPQRDPITIFGKLMSGCRNFFVADMSSGYFQVRLKDGPTGSDVTTFVCDRGVFRWLVMPMGIHPASDKLSEQMEAIFAELFRPVGGKPTSGSPMVRDLDDFLSGSPTKEGLLSNLRTFLRLCSEHGVYLNPSKFRVAIDDGNPDTSVTFAGIRVKQDGTFEVDPARLDAIRDFPKPRTKKELQRWLGLCTSLTQFAPTQLHVALNLQRELCRNTTNHALRWTPHVEEEFHKARIALSQPSTLHSFDPRLATGILTDVAKTLGIGILLFQFDPKYDLHPVRNFRLMGIWSIAAKPAWKDLSPLETEIVGFYQAYQKLHFYVYGARVIYGFVDHLPFVQAYHGKDMSELSARMFKLMNELLEIPFQMRYLSNKTQMIQAVDTLSRAPVNPSTELGWDPLDSQYHSDHKLPSGFTQQEACLYVSNTDACEWIGDDPSLIPLFEAAEEDNFYQQLCNVIENQNVSLSKLDQVPRDTEAQAWLHKNKKEWKQMGILRNSKGDRLLWIAGERVVVPAAARDKVLETLDTVHNGARRASHLAKRSYWWPDMEEDIDMHCQLCTACKEHRSMPPKEPSIPTPVPPHMGHTFGIDFAEVAYKSGKKTKFLLLSDYLSSWSCFFQFQRPPTSASIVKRLSDWFHLNCWPMVLATDGEGVFTSEEFTHWMKNNGIAHRLSSPDHAQSNGMAESTVKTFKRLWDKCQTSGDNFHSAWSFWMDTPKEPGQLSPTRMWFGRAVRHPSWFQAPERNPADTLVASQEAYIRRKETSRAYDPSHRAFKHNHTHTPLKVGSHVLVKNKVTQKYDIPAIVMQPTNSGRGARVRREDTGIFMIRNRKGIVVNPEYLTPILISSTSRVAASADQAKGEHQSPATKEVTFADMASVGEFETVGWQDELGKLHRIGIGPVTPCMEVRTFPSDFEAASSTDPAASVEIPDADSAQTMGSGSQPPDNTEEVGRSNLHAGAADEADGSWDQDTALPDNEGGNGGLENDTSTHSPPNSVPMQIDHAQRHNPEPVQEPVPEPQPNQPHTDTSSRESLHQEPHSAEDIFLPAWTPLPPQDVQQGSMHLRLHHGRHAPGISGSGVDAQATHPGPGQDSPPPDPERAEAETRPGGGQQPRQDRRPQGSAVHPGAGKDGDEHRTPHDQQRWSNRKGEGRVTTAPPSLLSLRVDHSVIDPHLLRIPDTPATHKGGDGDPEAQQHPDGRSPRGRKSSTFTWASSLFPGVDPSPHRPVTEPCRARTTPQGAGIRSARFPGANRGSSGKCTPGPRRAPPELTVGADHDPTIHLQPLGPLRPILRRHAPPCSLPPTRDGHVTDDPEEVPGDHRPSGQGPGQIFSTEPPLRRSSRLASTLHQSGPPAKEHGRRSKARQQ